MENPILNLQERLQKLIEQYSKDKAEIEQLKKQNEALTEENMQLFAQVEEYAKLCNDSDSQLKSLQAEYNGLKASHEALQNTFAGIESFANDAIKTIDNIFPQIGEED